MKGASFREDRYRYWYLKVGGYVVGLGLGPRSLRIMPCTTYSYPTRSYPGIFLGLDPNSGVLKDPVLLSGERVS